LLKFAIWGGDFPLPVAGGVVFFATAMTDPTKPDPTKTTPTNWRN
jgi:hypothetical protein